MQYQFYFVWLNTSVKHMQKYGEILIQLMFSLSVLVVYGPTLSSDWISAAFKK